jgi:hypothetical protein
MRSCFFGDLSVTKENLLRRLVTASLTKAPGLSQLDSQTISGRIVDVRITVAEFCKVGLFSIVHIENNKVKLISFLASLFFPD